MFLNYFVNVKGHGRYYWFTKAAFSGASDLSLLSSGLQQVVAPSHQCISAFQGCLQELLNWHILMTRAIQSLCTSFFLFGVHDQDTMKEKTNVLWQEYWVLTRSNYGNVHVAERYSRIVLWSPCAMKGVPSDIRYGNVAVKNSEGKIYAAWKDDLLRYGRQKTSLVLSHWTEKLGMSRWFLCLFYI